MKIAVQTEDFDVQAEVAALHGSPKVGAVVMFLGTVRDLNEGDEVASMTLEHYPGMTEKALTAIVKEAKKRWDIMVATVFTVSVNCSRPTRSFLSEFPALPRGEALKPVSSLLIT